MLKILTFPITKMDKLTFKDYDIIPIDWNNIPSNSTNCSVLFFQQVKNNISLFMKLEEKCRGVESIPCNKFDIMSVDYYDVLNRDIFAYTSENGIYAVVLIYNGEYYGNIYVWFDNNICYTIGIHSRPDLVFMENRQVTSIALKLLEGVRRLCSCKGYTKIVIPEPLGIMDKILDSIEFAEVKGLDEFKTTNGLYNVDEITRVRYTEDVTTPMIYDKMSFILIE